MALATDAGPSLARAGVFRFGKMCPEALLESIYTGTVRFCHPEGLYVQAGRVVKLQPCQPRAQKAARKGFLHRGRDLAVVVENAYFYPSLVDRPPLSKIADCLRSIKSSKHLDRVSWGRPFGIPFDKLSHLKQGRCNTDTLSSRWAQSVPNDLSFTEGRFGRISVGTRVRKHLVADSDHRNVDTT